jgi:nicotinamide-nucleotide amidase
MRPREATVLANDHGTAPGLYFPPMAAAAGPSGRTPHIFLLPGPPRELGPMMENRVAPLLGSIAPKSDQAMKIWQIVGLGESHVEERVGEELLALGIELGYCARPGEVDLRAIGRPEQLAAAEAIVSAKLEPHISTRDSRPLEQVVVDLLRSRSETVATAESCTGGYLAHRITNVPGASKVFVEGFVTYANEAKIRALGVAPELLQQHGAVSHETAIAMASGALREAGTTYALATTGPDGGVPGKPVGTVYVALAAAGAAPVVSRYCFPTDRLTFKDLVVQTALNTLRRRMNGTEGAESGNGRVEPAAKLG